ncbi:uncharacterized protein LOC128388982 [Panonychus citri]|nr:uncharacterized protein LOC128388982 [Panonychus citri]XP_053204446.1 uncharacterized protein LOC128388982 [Panonychus citri]XP_053204447.1 uncharacterized protein LOC128388982 [Panonychus citri]XP_053204448.1 uncharacterized protein LOC128388982 [Panonychus citri]
MFDGEEIRYNGPEMSNLKILESYTFEGHDNCSAFHLMDFCPSLESAFMKNFPEDDFIDLSLKNYNLRDLVIEMPTQEDMNWSFLRDLLSKYPNLHNLAIRMSDEIEDCHVEELVEILPEVKLLDFRKCENITQRSADFLAKYCAKSKRSIKIYYDCEKEPIDWPKYDTPRESIVHGLDFMKHCFYKSFSNLPFLIDE